MIEFKHTPGPWFTVKIDDEWVTITEEEGEKCGFIDVWGHSGTTAQLELEANARLIAAAPELLKRLECSTVFMEQMVAAGDNRMVLSERIKRNRATIAKVAGVPDEA